MFSNKKGITLIELIIAIALISVLSTILVKSKKDYDEYTNNINIDYSNNSIMNFINEAKGYCRAKEAIGYITFDSINNCMSFYSQGRQIKRFIFPNKFALIEVNLGEGKHKMEIDKIGFTSNACTISYSDRKGVIHRVSICVGTAYVDIQD